MKDNNIVVGTWSWGVGGFAGGDSVFGNHLLANNLTEVLDWAISSGINTFDTAFAYANGESEKILGQLLKEYDRSDYIVSDKFTPQMADLNSKNPLMQMLDGSLDRLGMDYIDIYWIHNSSDIEKWTPYLADAIKSKKVNRIGVSNHNLEQVKRVQEILKKFGVEISAVQNHFSLLYRNSIEDGLLNYCRENKIEFFSYMVLEQGALSGKYDKNHLLPEQSSRGLRYNKIFEKLDNLLNELRRLADKYGVSPAQIATSWAIGRGTTPIIGMTSAEQVKDATNLKELYLSEEELKNLEQIAISTGVDTKGGWEGIA